MMEVQVSLHFACCYCLEPVTVTVKCEGKGLALAGRTVASVAVPCPTCNAISRLYFEPNGTVRHVCPHGASRPLPEPSIN